MSIKRVSLSHPKQRSILTDMLPYEVPLTFSNSGFFRFCRKFELEIAGSNLNWLGESTAVSAMVKFLFGYNQTSTPEAEFKKQWGRVSTRFSLPISQIKSRTLPFQFAISHHETSRILTIIHPGNQVLIANFYAQFHNAITYYCAKSTFSLRKPQSLAKYVYFDDRLHQSSVDLTRGHVEEDTKEYEQLGSFFVYRRFSNIHKFFESRLYHRLEKKFNRMLQVDISRCFDSIYSHSIAWAVYGKAQTKFNLDLIDRAFPDRFDRLMQECNHGETNGIVIGPEFSRVFAELILQYVDCELEARLKQDHGLLHKRHYEVLRYVDDYFIFFDEISHVTIIEQCLQTCLGDFKLSLNKSKSKMFEKPIVTEITIAKNRISELLNLGIARADMLADDISIPPGKPSFSGNVNCSRLIVGVKTIIKETGVAYPDVMNYLMTIIERKRRLICECYSITNESYDDQQKLTQCVIALIDFAFFLYSATPRVNQSIRLCRLISDTVSFYNSNAVAKDVRDLLFKFMFDNLSHELGKNCIAPYREIETQYLLLAIRQLGRSYSLSVETLARHFGIHELGGYYQCTLNLNYFSLTTLISYIGGRKKYEALSSLIEDECLAYIDHRKAFGSLDTSSTLLFLDLLVCPFVTDWLKHEAGSLFGLDRDECSLLQSAHDEWFIAWGEKFDVGKKLDAKRSRQVY